MDERPENGRISAQPEERTPETRQKTEPEQPRIDPHLLQMLLNRLRSEQNLVMGAVGGLAGAGAGALAWTVVTVMTGTQYGFLAIVVGILAGGGVRLLGKGIDRVFQLAGAVTALLGVMSGNVAIIIHYASLETGLSRMDLLSRLTPDRLLDLLGYTFSGMNLLFYGLAIYAGYRMSLRKIPESELAKLTR